MDIGKSVLVNVLFAVPCVIDKCPSVDLNWICRVPVWEWFALNWGPMPGPGALTAVFLYKLSAEIPRVL